MKRLITFLSVLYAVAASSQSFHRGAVVLDLNTGIEAFNTTQRYKGLTELPDTMVRSLAANHHFVLGLEVGLNKRIGIGIKGKANTFFRDLDAVTRQRAALRSTDLTMCLNLHLVSRKKFDLLAGSDIGISDLDLRFNDLDDMTLSSVGFYLAPYLNPRVYLGRFGFNLRASLPFVNYAAFKQSGETKAGSYILSAWKGSGFSASLGVQVHLF